MKKTSKTIIFFGSGPVAAASLRLLSQDFSIEAVITKPRSAHHSGDVPVLDIAKELAIPVHTATDKQSLTELFATRALLSKVAILIDFGIIIPQSVIDYFPSGIINSHFSLLPEWRGADPITFAILSGQKQTGVSLMILVAGMDEGPLIAQSPLQITPVATTPSLTDDLIELSYTMLALMLPKYLAGSIAPYTQNQSIAATYSRKLSKEDGTIHWEKPADQIEREVRAYSGWPKSRVSLGSIDVIITQSHVIKVAGKPGTLRILGKLPVIYCGDNALAIDRIKPAGKKEMTGEAFLAGYKQQLTLL